MLTGARSITASAKRVALIGLLALASHALLPYVHVLIRGCGAVTCSGGERESSASHSPDCAVCSAIAHAGARAVDAPVAVAGLQVPVEPHAPAPTLFALVPTVERDVACARAPPVSLRLA